MSSAVRRFGAKNDASGAGAAKASSTTCWVGCGGYEVSTESGAGAESVIAASASAARSFWDLPIYRPKCLGQLFHLARLNSEMFSDGVTSGFRVPALFRGAL